MWVGQLKVGSIGMRWGQGIVMVGLNQDNHQDGHGCCTLVVDGSLWSHLVQNEFFWVRIGLAKLWSSTFKQWESTLPILPLHDRALGIIFSGSQSWSLLQLRRRCWKSAILMCLLSIVVEHQKRIVDLVYWSPAHSGSVPQLRDFEIIVFF